MDFSESYKANKELIKQTIEMIKKTVSLGTFKRTPASVINRVIVLEMQEKYPYLEESEIHAALYWIRETLNNNR